jgi:DNA-binding response OmpR family regulator
VTSAAPPWASALANGSTAGYLTKPFGIDELVAAIDEALEGSADRSGAAGR